MDSRSVRLGWLGYSARKPKEQAERRCDEATFEEVLHLHNEGDLDSSFTLLNSLGIFNSEKEEDITSCNLIYNGLSGHLHDKNWEQRKRYNHWQDQSL